VAAVVSIGEFSRLTRISVKALRHYHDVGILVPASVDQQSKYRSYELTQLADAQLIRRLRQLDMPLDSVRVVVTATSRRARNDAIAMHLDHMERQLEQTRDMVSSLRALLADHVGTGPVGTGPVGVDEILVRTVEPISALQVRAVVASGDVEAWVGQAFGQLAKVAESRDLTMDGESGALFATSFFEDGKGPVTAFVGLNFTPTDPGTVLPPGYTIGIVAGGEYAVGIHRGPYENLDCTYGTVGSYVNTHYVTSAAPIRERYLVGPDVTATPADYRTEVMWPLTSKGPNRS
jgi:DNA-binding transcriptional MerR regulator/effector-binding domain-containing protein